MRQRDGVELAVDEALHVVGREPLHEDGVGHPRLDIVVRAELQRRQQPGLRDQDEVVVLGEILEEQAQPPQVPHVDEVRVVDDRREHLARVVDATGLLDQPLLAADDSAASVDLKRVAQDAQHAVVGVQRAIDDGGDESLGVMVDQGMLEHALARSRLANDEA